MITQLLLATIVVLLLACVALLAAVLRRQARGGAGEVDTKLALIGAGQERAERALRDEAARSREEAGRGARELREEVTATLKGVNDTVVRTLGEMSAAQNRQVETFAARLDALGAATGEQLDRVRLTVEGRLESIRADNASQLEQVRHTVDEKLHGMLEQRLGESFRQVSERLELVHRGLGEMQTLASGVGDLKKVLANVKVRGTWGEVQLGNLLREVLTEGQFAANVATNEYTGHRVEYAIRLPGHDLGPVWLPVDAKFPLEDYQRLVDAHDAGDLAAIDASSRALEARIRASAKEICQKYLNPPQTTDFALMFLPIEGLYAEVVRRAGLVEQIQREFRVVVAGPVTLLAILNSSNYALITNCPWETLADLDGHKIQAAGANIQWLNNTGATPVQGGLSDTYNGIQTGVFDGMLIHYQGMDGFKLYEVAPYVAKLNFGSLPRR